MKQDLPTPVHDYFHGKNTCDFARAISGFSPSAVVADEGHRHEGPTAIRVWMEQTTAKYNDTAEVMSARSDSDTVEALARVTGTFPGSPILLRFKFTLDGNKIIRLEIAS